MMPAVAEAPTISVRVQEPGEELPRDFETRAAELGATRGYGGDARWRDVLRDGLRHRLYQVEAFEEDRFAGFLPLAFVESRLFGRFLVSLPYLNSAGVFADNDDTAVSLIDAAVELADRLNVNYLELRHERRIPHEALTFERTEKVHMRVALPQTFEGFLAGLKSKVRSQVKKSESYGHEAVVGGMELLPDYYSVFARNMRDLGTPVFGRELFAAILKHFGDDAELVVVRNNGRPVAGAVLIHGDQTTQVPSASALREYNPTNANMFLYRHLLERAIERGSTLFDFGRSSEDSGTYKFKKQWGAEPHPAVWQYYLRKGNADDMRPESAKNQRRIKIWQKLPVWLTRLIGPTIVRGIP